MHGHHRKIRVFLTKKIQGMVVASQAALCVTLLQFAFGDFLLLLR